MLKNKTYKSYSYTSRYSPFPVYYNDKTHKDVYGITSYLSDDTNYTLHIVKQSETLDTLALKYYNNPTLFWLICSFNHIRNPFTKIVPGQTLKIPSISVIKFDTEGRS